MLGSLTSTLREAGYTVFALYNGDAACQAAISMASLDLLITNTRLADLGAPELIRRVLETKPDLRILHIGEPLPPDDRHPAVPTLREPYTPTQLLAAVRELMLPPA